MITMTSLAIDNAAQATASRLARKMLHLQQRFDFSLTEYPRKEFAENVAAQAGQNLASMLILELKNCTHFTEQHLCLSVTRIRQRYSEYFSSKDFRQAAKSYLCAWALLEAKKRQMDSDSTGWFISRIDGLANLVLSPVGITELESSLVRMGWETPLQFAPFEGVGPDDDQMVDILCRLPEFLGVLDFADTKTTKTIFSMFPKSLVSPALYENPAYFGSDSLSFLDTLHRSLYHRYPALEEAYEVELGGTSCKSVMVAEFEGKFAPYGDYRLLAATINHEDTPGSDVYLAVNTPYIFKSALLVSEEIAADIGPGVVGQVYDAYAHALSSEVGEWVDIEELEWADED